MGRRASEESVGGKHCAGLALLFALLLCGVPCVGGETAAVFSDATGVTATTGDLVKTAGAGYNAYGIADQVFTAGGQVRAARWTHEAGRYMAGLVRASESKLSGDNTLSTNEATAFTLSVNHANRRFSVLERGETVDYVAVFGAGDEMELRVSDSGTVQYLRNGVFVYESETALTAADYPLVLKFELYDTNSHVSNAALLNASDIASAPLALPESLSALSWQGDFNARMSTDATTGRAYRSYNSATWDSGVVSTFGIQSPDKRGDVVGFVAEYRQYETQMAVGLVPAGRLAVSWGSSSSEVYFGFSIDTSYRARIIDDGTDTQLPVGGIRAGDTVQFLVNADERVEYFLNGELVYTSTHTIPETAAYPLFASVSCYTYQSGLASAHWVNATTADATAATFGEFVRWTGYSQSYLSVNDNTGTLSKSNNNWRSAMSKQLLHATVLALSDANDGSAVVDHTNGVEFTVPSSSSHEGFVGFSSIMDNAVDSDGGSNMHQIANNLVRYGLFCDDQRRLWVRDGGMGMGRVAGFLLGDRLGVFLAQRRFHYTVNGRLVYRGQEVEAADFPLAATAFLYSSGSNLGGITWVNATVPGDAFVASPGDAVEWTGYIPSYVAIDADARSVRKTRNTESSDTSLVSTQTVAAVDSTGASVRGFKFTMDRYVNAYVGLTSINDEDSNQDSEMDFALYLTGGYVYTQVGGHNTRDNYRRSSFSAGDQFAVVVDADRHVRFYHNNQVLGVTFDPVPESMFPLAASTMLLSYNAQLGSVEWVGADYAPPGRYTVAQEMEAAGITVPGSFIQEWAWPERFSQYLSSYTASTGTLRTNGQDVWRSVSSRAVVSPVDPDDVRGIEFQTNGAYYYNYAGFANQEFDVEYVNDQAEIWYGAYTDYHGRLYIIDEQVQRSRPSGTVTSGTVVQVRFNDDNRFEVAVDGFVVYTSSRPVVATALYRAQFMVYNANTNLQGLRWLTRANFTSARPVAGTPVEWAGYEPNRFTFTESTATVYKSSDAWRSMSSLFHIGAPGTDGDDAVNGMEFQVTRTNNWAYMGFEVPEYSTSYSQSSSQWFALYFSGSTVNLYVDFVSIGDITTYITGDVLRIMIDADRHFRVMKNKKYVYRSNTPIPETLLPMAVQYVSYGNTQELQGVRWISDAYLDRTPPRPLEFIEWEAETTQGYEFVNASTGFVQKTRQDDSCNTGVTSSKLIRSLDDSVKGFEFSVTQRQSYPSVVVGFTVQGRDHDISTDEMFWRFEIATNRLVTVYSEGQSREVRAHYTEGDVLQLRIHPTSYKVQFVVAGKVVYESDVPLDQSQLPLYAEVTLCQRDVVVDNARWIDVGHFQDVVDGPRNLTFTGVSNPAWWNDLNRGSVRKLYTTSGQVYGYSVQAVTKDSEIRGVRFRMMTIRGLGVFLGRANSDTDFGFDFNTNREGANYEQTRFMVVDRTQTNMDTLTAGGYTEGDQFELRLNDNDQVEFVHKDRLVWTSAPVLQDSVYPLFLKIDLYNGWTSQWLDHMQWLAADEFTACTVAHPGDFVQWTGVSSESRMYDWYANGDAYSRNSNVYPVSHFPIPSLGADIKGMGFRSAPYNYQHDVCLTPLYQACLYGFRSDTSGRVFPFDRNALKTSVAYQNSDDFQLYFDDDDFFCIVRANELIYRSEYPVDNQWFPMHARIYFNNGGGRVYGATWLSGQDRLVLHRNISLPVDLDEPLFHREWARFPITDTTAVRGFRFKQTSYDQYVGLSDINKQSWAHAFYIKRQSNDGMMYGILDRTREPTGWELGGSLAYSGGFEINEFFEIRLNRDNRVEYVVGDELVYTSEDALDPVRFPLHLRRSRTDSTSDMAWLEPRSFKVVRPYAVPGQFLEWSRITHSNYLDLSVPGRVYKVYSNGDVIWNYPLIAKGHIKQEDYLTGGACGVKFVPTYNNRYHRVDFATTPLTTTQGGVVRLYLDPNGKVWFTDIAYSQQEQIVGSYDAGDTIEMRIANDSHVEVVRNGYILRRSELAVQPEVHLPMFVYFAMNSAGDEVTNIVWTNQTFFERVVPIPVPGDSVHWVNEHSTTDFSFTDGCVRALTAGTQLYGQYTFDPADGIIGIEFTPETVHRSFTVALHKWDDSTSFAFTFATGVVSSPETRIGRFSRNDHFQLYLNTTTGRLQLQRDGWLLYTSPYHMSGELPLRLRVYAAENGASLRHVRWIGSVNEPRMLQPGDAVEWTGLYPHQATSEEAGTVTYTQSAAYNSPASSAMILSFDDAVRGVCFSPTSNTVQANIGLGTQTTSSVMYGFALLSGRRVKAIDTIYGPLTVAGEIGGYNPGDQFDLRLLDDRTVEYCTNGYVVYKSTLELDATDFPLVLYTSLSTGITLSAMWLGVEHFEYSQFSPGAPVIWSGFDTSTSVAPEGTGSFLKLTSSSTDNPVASGTIPSINDGVQGVRFRMNVYAFFQTLNWVSDPQKRDFGLLFASNGFVWAYDANTQSDRLGGYQAGDHFEMRLVNGHMELVREGELLYTRRR